MLQMGYIESFLRDVGANNAGAFRRLTFDLFIMTNSRPMVRSSITLIAELREGAREHTMWDVRLALTLPARYRNEKGIDVQSSVDVAQEAEDWAKLRDDIQGVIDRPEQFWYYKSSSEPVIQVAERMLEEARARQKL